MKAGDKKTLLNQIDAFVETARTKEKESTAENLDDLIINIFESRGLLNAASNNNLEELIQKWSKATIDITLSETYSKLEHSARKARSLIWSLWTLIFYVAYYLFFKNHNDIYIKLFSEPKLVTDHLTNTSSMTSQYNIIGGFVFMGIVFIYILIGKFFSELTYSWKFRSQIELYKDTSGCRAENIKTPNVFGEFFTYNNGYLLMFWLVSLSWLPGLAIIDYINSLTLPIIIVLPLLQINIYKKYHEMVK